MAESEDLSVPGWVWILIAAVVLIGGVIVATLLAPADPPAVAAPAEPVKAATPATRTEATPRTYSTSARSVTRSSAGERRISELDRTARALAAFDNASSSILPIYERHIDQLARTFNESPEMIAAKTSKCQDLMRDKGIRVTCLEILQEASTIRLEARQAGVSYAEVLAVYMTLRQQGF